MNDSTYPFSFSNSFRRFAWSTCMPPSATAVHGDFDAGLDESFGEVPAREPAALGVGVGAGLGLLISYNIIEKHGGHLEVESEPGMGATFIIVLPL